jgi:hypothetical protein
MAPIHWSPSHLNDNPLLDPVVESAQEVLDVSHGIVMAEVCDLCPNAIQRAVALLRGLCIEVLDSDARAYDI